MINVAAMGETVGLRAWRASLLFYNNDTEYIVFDEMYSLCLASAKALRVPVLDQPIWAIASTAKPETKENTVNMPICSTATTTRATPRREA